MTSRHYARGLWTTTTAYPCIFCPLFPSGSDCPIDCPQFNNIFRQSVQEIDEYFLLKGLEYIHGSSQDIFHVIYRYQTMDTLHKECTNDISQPLQKDTCVSKCIKQAVMHFKNMIVSCLIYLNMELWLQGKIVAL